ncbi:hypothetical protein ACIQZI_14460 [Peribacillus sp. NPDC096379]
MIYVITGEITPENKQYGKSDLILSPRGVEILLEELGKACK